MVIEPKKLIKNKMKIEDIKKVDPKILKLAKEEIEKERAQEQQRKAEDFLRSLLKEKDKAEEVVKGADMELVEINRNLKVFEGKK